MKINLIVASVIICMNLYADENAGKVATNACACTGSSEESREIERLIALAPAMMLSQTNNVRDYMEQVCKRISQCPDVQMRYKHFRNFMASACQVNLENVVRMVPFEKIEMPTVDDSWKPSVRTLKDRARRKREQDIARLKGRALGRLETIAENIFCYLLVAHPVPAPGAELFEPYFKLIEKFKDEERRVGRKEDGLCDRVTDQVEYLFNFIHLSVLESAGVKPDPQDRVAVEARFRQVVGRPIRSAEQYEADARRRTEANIREHRKIEEDNRKALEVQRKNNKEHNIDVK